MRFLPIFTLIFNMIFIKMFETTLARFIPSSWLPFNDYIRTILIYLILLFIMYSPVGQRIVAFFIKGRNTIGREEKVLQPIIEELKEKTDIKGYSSTVWVQFKVLNALNKLTGKVIKPLDTRVNNIKAEYLTGTVKIFSFDSLDIETNSYGNSIFISKGAIDTLSHEELRAVIYNEFAQIKTNIANIRLFHDGTILISRLCSIATLILVPFALTIGIASSSTLSLITASSNGSLGANVSSIFAIIFYGMASIIRIILWFFTKKYTNIFYMMYERKIFINADRATHKAGFSAEMLSYLEKLYNFKLGDKETSILVELRPLVAYRINYFDNVLGRNRELSESNKAWSSNYMERVQTINNNKK